jgi:hypothetical protein
MSASKFNAEQFLESYEYKIDDSTKKLIDNLYLLERKCTDFFDHSFSENNELVVETTEDQIIATLFGYCVGAFSMCYPNLEADMAFDFARTVTYGYLHHVKGWFHK